MAWRLILRHSPGERRGKSSRPLQPSFESRVSLEEQVESEFDHVIVGDFSIHLNGCELEIMFQFLVCGIQDSRVDLDVVEAGYLKYQTR